MSEMKTIPRKCPKCGSIDIGIYSYNPFPVSCVIEAEVNCINCGIIGSVKARVVPLRGTFEEIEG